MAKIRNVDLGTLEGVQITLLEVVDATPKWLIDPEERTWTFFFRATTPWGKDCVYDSVYRVVALDLEGLNLKAIREHQLKLAPLVAVGPGLQGALLHLKLRA